MAPRDRAAAMLALAALWPLACSGANPATSTPPDPTCNTQIGYSPFKYGPGVPGMQWFTKAKLGMFMHYGPVSQWGTEISFPLVCKQLPCTVRAMNNSNVVIKTQEELAAHRQAYADLAKTFNPTQFDADAMAQMAKDAGFEYLMYTTVHCDGFLNWNSSLSNYTIMNTPYSRDLYGDLANALRRKGMRVGAYICPSLWNNDDYWAPNALTALGPVCRPNYTPDANAANTTAWTRYLTYLHGLVAELADKYQPDAFWFDCTNEPPIDTRLEKVLGNIRDANSESVVNTRNGVFSDYTLGQSAGVHFEVPSVLQSSHQWAYDPNSGQKPVGLILANIILLVSKGGNYLLNVAPGPSGVWPDSAVTVLKQLGAWMAVNGEAIKDTMPSYPFQFDGVYITSKEKTVYAIVPRSKPGEEIAASTTWQALHSGLGTTGAADDAPTANLTLGWFRPELLADTITGVEQLGSGPATYRLEEGTGLVVAYTPAPAVLRSFWSPVLNDTAPCATRDGGTCSTYTASDDKYSLKRAEAGCLPAAGVPGTTAVSLTFNAAPQDNSFGSSTFHQPGYEVVETECYLFTSAASGRIPVDAYWSGARNDTWVVASDSSRAEALRLGYVKTATLGYGLPVPSNAGRGAVAASSDAIVFKITFG